MARSKVKGNSQFKLLMDKLPPEHKSIWFAGAALCWTSNGISSIYSIAKIGTIPRIEFFEMMLSAGRLRKISLVPIIQSFAQLDKNYGKEGSDIITENCQLSIFGGFAPNSETAYVLSKALLH